MSWSIGPGSACMNCKHFTEGFPVHSKRCLTCEETSGNPTHFERVELSITTSTDTTGDWHGDTDKAEGGAS